MLSAVFVIRLLVTCGAVQLLCSSCTLEPCKKLTRGPRMREDELTSLTSDPVPRCAVRDPACGPEAVASEGDACYRPSRERELLPRGERPPKTDPRFRCTHDGECLIAGCGNVCVDYHHRRLETTCHAFDWLDETVLCGCVEGSCSFFKQ